MILCFIPLCLHSSWILSSLTLLQELDEWVHKIACFVNAERESGLFSSLSMTILWTRIIGMRLNCAFSSKEQNFCYFTQFISCTANLIWPWTSMYVFWSSLPARTVLKTLHTDEVWKSKLFKSPLSPPPLLSTPLFSKIAFLQSETMVPTGQIWQADFLLHCQLYAPLLSIFWNTDYTGLLKLCALLPPLCYSNLIQNRQNTSLEAGPYIESP